MKLAKNGEAGQVLIWALILLAMGPLLVVPMLRLSSSSQGYNQMTEIYTLNAYAADSGIEYAKYQIYSNPAEIVAFGLDEYLVINNIDVHVTAEYMLGTAAYKIISTAGTVESSVAIECTIVIDVGLFGNVVACNGDLTLDHCVFENPEFPGESDVYTSGNVHLIQSTIDGDVNVSGTYTDDGHSLVTGNITQGAEVLEFPSIDAEIHEEKAKAGGNSTGINWNNQGIKNLGPIYVEGDLIVSRTDLILEGTVYVTGTVSIDRAGLTGFGDILAEGNLLMERYSLDIGDSEILPLLMSVNGDITLDRDTEGWGETYAIVYAPGGTINLNLIDLYGSVAALFVNLNQSEIFYPAELRGRADLPGAGLDTVTYIFQ